MFYGLACNELKSFVPVCSIKYPSLNLCAFLSLCSRFCMQNALQCNVSLCSLTPLCVLLDNLFLFFTVKHPNNICSRELNLHLNFILKPHYCSSESDIKFYIPITIEQDLQHCCRYSKGIFHGPIYSNIFVCSQA